MKTAVTALVCVVALSAMGWIVVAVHVALVPLVAIVRWLSERSDEINTEAHIDMNGIRYVVIRYGTQYQLLMPYKEGHVSIGVELEDDPREIARKVAEHLKLPM